EDADLDGLGPLDERARDQIRRRHQAIGGLVMLIDADDVKPETLTADELLDIGRILLSTLGGIVHAVRQHRPRRTIFLGLDEIEVPIWHQVEKNELHTAASSMNFLTFANSASDASICGRWPQFSKISTCAWGIRSFQ